MPAEMSGRAFDESAVRKRLALGLSRLQLELPESSVESLVAYLRLLHQWNKTYNLTAIRDPLEMVTLHLLDSLAIVPKIQAGGGVIDVGSGAGLPGIPLAVARPELSVTLMDSNGKKTRFLQHAITTLRLRNVAVVHSRAESFRPPELFEVVVSRAFTSLEEMIALTRHLLAPKGRFVAMKGHYPQEELESLPADVVVLETVPVQVPELDAERHLIILALSEGAGIPLRPTPI